MCLLKFNMVIYQMKIMRLYLIIILNPITIGIRLK